MMTNTVTPASAAQDGLGDGLKAELRTRRNASSAAERSTALPQTLRITAVFRMRPLRWFPPMQRANPYRREIAASCLPDRG
jgi:hypothetical protein